MHHKTCSEAKCSAQANNTLRSPERLPNQLLRSILLLFSMLVLIAPSIFVDSSGRKRYRVYSSSNESEGANLLRDSSIQKWVELFYPRVHTIRKDVDQRIQVRQWTLCGSP